MTDRWRQPFDDTERRPLFNGVKDLTLNHPGYTGRTHQDTPPSVRVGLRLACGPLGSWHPTTSELRRAFLRVLSQRPIAEFVAGMTHVEGLTWTARDSHGRHSHGAVLAGGQDDVAPTAWARVLLPESGGPSFWRDPQCADVVLHVEPRTRHGELAPARDLTSWHRHFTRALAIPQAIAASLLVEELGLVVSREPATKVAVWLSARDNLTQLVDINDCQRVPGTHVSGWFNAYAVADTAGQAPPAVATEWIRQMCDDVLHLDGYEPILLSFSAGSGN